MRNATAATVTFGAGGTAAAHQGAGWSVGEDEHTWTTGVRSQLSFDAPRAPHGFVLEISWSALLHPPVSVSGWATVLVNAWRAFGLGGI